MAIKIGINGYGRIGRNVVRAIHEYGRLEDDPNWAITGSVAA